MYSIFFFLNCIRQIVNRLLDTKTENLLQNENGTLAGACLLLAPAQAPAVLENLRPPVDRESFFGNIRIFDTTAAVDCPSGNWITGCCRCFELTAGCAQSSVWFSECNRKQNGSALARLLGGPVRIIPTPTAWLLNARLICRGRC